MNYILTVALHAFALSAFAALVVLFIRQPQHRATATLLVLIAITFLPWISASHPLLSTNPLVDDSNPTIHAFTNRSLTLLDSQNQLATPDFVKPATPEPEADSIVSTAHLPWRKILIAIWITGTLLSFVHLLIRTHRLRRWKSTLRVPESEELKRLPPSPCLIGGPGTPPSILGFFQPAIIIPCDLLAKPRQLHWTLAHELAHLRSRDTQVTTALALLGAIHWWNPLLHLLVSQWTHAREQLCDLAATSPHERADYSEFLLSIASKGKTPSLALARHPLHHRITSLLKAPKAPIKPKRALVPVVTLLLITATAFLSLVRLQAEEPRITKTTESQAEPPTPQPSPPSEQKEPEAPQPEETEVVWLIMDSRFITTSEPLPDQNSILSHEEVQKRLLHLAGVKETILTRLPDATIKIPQSASLEILRESPKFPKGERFDESGNVARPFAGIVLGLQPTASEKKTLSLKTNITVSLEPGMTFRGDGKYGEIDWDNLKVLSVETRARIPIGTTLRVNVGEIEPGRYIEAYLTPAPIDPTGRTIESYTAFPAPKIVPTPAYHTTLRATLIELPLSPEDQKKENLESYTYASPWQTPHKDALKKIELWKADPKAIVTELPPVKLHQPARQKTFLPEPPLADPWKELPTVRPRISVNNEAIWLTCNTLVLSPPYQPHTEIPWRLPVTKDIDWMLKIPSPSPEKRRILVLSLSEIETGPMPEP